MNLSLGAGHLIAVVVGRLVETPPEGPSDWQSQPVSEYRWDIFGPIIGVVAFVLVFIYLRRTLRNWSGETEVQRWARKHRMRYTKRNDALSLNWAEKPFGYAARTCYNVVLGSYRGHRTVLFDLGDRSSSSMAARVAFADDSATKQRLRGHAASVAVMSLPFFVDTDITLRPLKGMTRLWQRDKGGSRIELESEDFNRLYDVVCTDRTLVYAIFPPRTIDVLVDQPPVEIRVRGMQVMVIGDGPLRADVMDSWTTLLVAIVENVDDFLWTDRGHDAVHQLRSDWSDWSTKPQG